MTDLHAHLVDDVLAWWLAHGPDDVHGGVLTCWDNAGRRLVSGDKYTWSQGRWAWLTAQLALDADRLAVDRERLATQSLRTARFIRDHALLPDGTTAFVTTREGTPREPTPGDGRHTSVFADLFAALGWSGAARLEPGAGWEDLALRTLLDAAGRIRAGSFRSEPYPVDPRHRSFGLPMILVGVGEQVYRATGEDAAADTVRAAAHDIEAYHRTGADIAEMPPATDEAGQDSLLARHRTPGHILEAVAFLRHARDLLDGPLATDRTLAAIALHALEIGWDEAAGGLLRFTDRDGGAPAGSRSCDHYEQLVVSTWDTKLWWPHAEAMYTTSLLARTTGEPALRDWAQRLTAYTMNTFPDGPGKEWTQIRSRDGMPLEETVALPVKDPFHIARSLLWLTQLDRFPTHPDESQERR